MRKKGTKFEIVLEQIEFDILSGQFLPRERMVEDDLIERYNATRAVIRKVLKELEQKHLVKHVPNRGSQVAEPTRKEMEDIFQTRLLLENFAIDNIRLPIPEDALQQIAQCHDDYQKAIKENDFRWNHSANRMFHYLICLQCGNKVIADFLDLLKLRSHFWQLHNVGHPDRIEQTIEEHRLMYDFLVSGNLNDLKKVNEEHLSRGYKMFINNLNVQNDRTKKINLQ